MDQQTINMIRLVLKEELEPIKQELSEIKDVVNRIEQTQQEDIIGMLKHTQTKTDGHEYKINAINKRLLDVEANIQRLRNQ